MLGSSAEVQSNIEANTHIANLCDLLERIWGHGLRKREVSVTSSPSLTICIILFFNCTSIYRKTCECTCTYYVSTCTRYPVIHYRASQHYGHI